jgi:hypothetical protein
VTLQTLTYASPRGGRVPAALIVPDEQAVYDRHLWLAERLGIAKPEPLAEAGKAGLSAPRP